MTEPPFTDEEKEFFASCGIDVGRRERIEQIQARQRARNPVRKLWRWLKRRLG